MFLKSIVEMYILEYNLLEVLYRFSHGRFHMGFYFQESFKQIADALVKVGEGVANTSATIQVNWVAVYQPEA